MRVELWRSPEYQLVTQQAPAFEIITSRILRKNVAPTQ